VCFIYDPGFLRNQETRVKTEPSDPDHFSMVPLGVQMYPPPQPTGKMVAGTCEVNIIEEKSVLLFFYILLHTISNGYPLIHGLLRTHFSAPSNTRIPTTMVVM